MFYFGRRERSSFNGSVHSEKSRTVAVYVEDGNEMNNIISHNVGICSRDDNCGSRGLHWQDNGEVRVT